MRKTALWLAAAACLLVCKNAYAAPFAYIANSGDATVSVIDLATNTVVRTIELEAAPGPVAVSPDGSRLYVFTRPNSTLNVIDLATYETIQEVQLLNRPFINDVLPTPDGSSIYLADGDGSLGQPVWIVDATTYQITKLSAGPDNHTGIAFNSDATRLYVTQVGWGGGQSMISVVDPASQATIAYVDVSPAQGSSQIAVNPAGTNVYVTQSGFFANGNTVSVIDAATNTKAASIEVGIAPMGIALTADGRHAYVANNGSGTVSVIDTETQTVIATIAAGAGAYGVALTSDDTRAVVTNTQDNTVTVIDTATNTAIATIPVGAGPVSQGRFASFEPVTGPDLLDNALAVSTAIVSPGQKVTITDTVLNDGLSWARSSTTRYYLSVDELKDAADVVLTGSRAVPELTAGQSSAGSKVVTVPATTPLGAYHVLACADDTNKILEPNESNNCSVSADLLLVAVPDLLVSALGAAPVSLQPGGKFSVTSVVRNDGNATAAASTTRYFLSEDTARSDSDILLSGSQGVVSLDPGTAVTATRMVTLPTGTPSGTYHLIACADDLARVAEFREDNNCFAAETPTSVGTPDLVTTAVSDPPSTIVVGAKFAVTDTVSNFGDGSAAATSTWYFLSFDAARSGDDVKLTGARSVTTLAPASANTGSKTVTVPAGTAPGTYYLLACADGALKLSEASEVNNCKASAVSVVVNR